MTLTVATALSNEVHSNSVGGAAARRVLDAMGRKPIAACLMIESAEYELQQVLLGAAALLGDVPIFGFSSNGELTHRGLSERSVALAAISGDSAGVRVGYWPGFEQNTAAVIKRMLMDLAPSDANGGLLLCADGFSANLDSLPASLAGAACTIGGCLTGGEPHTGRLQQTGGLTGGLISGTGGLAAAYFGPEVAIGVGSTHGWLATGAFARVTRSRGVWIRGLDGQRPADVYATMFGVQAREWSFPPLNQMVRLYPLALESRSRPTALELRSPVRMEADGSLRMMTHIPENTAVHFMITSTGSALQAARLAARSALAALGGRPPALGLILADQAYRMLFEADPGAEARAISEVLGPGVPLIGGYSIGQVCRSAPGLPVELLNQHIQVILFAERA